jgi:hypothetical protein
MNTKDLIIFLTHKRFNTNTKNLFFMSLQYMLDFFSWILHPSQYIKVHPQKR